MKKLFEILILKLVPSHLKTDSFDNCVYFLQKCL